MSKESEVAAQVRCKLQGHNGIMFMRDPNTQYYRAYCSDCGAMYPQKNIDLRFV